MKLSALLLGLGLSCSVVGFTAAEPVCTNASTPLECYEAGLAYIGATLAEFNKTKTELTQQVSALRAENAVLRKEAESERQRLTELMDRLAQMQWVSGFTFKYKTIKARPGSQPGHEFQCDQGSIPIAGGGWNVEHVAYYQNENKGHEEGPQWRVTVANLSGANNPEGSVTLFVTCAILKSFK
jgi:hypothetical protein